MKRTHLLNRMHCCLTACLVLAIFLFPATVFAHKVSIFAWVEDDQVHTQSKFFGGKPVSGAAVRVSDPSGKKLLEGVTSAEGLLSFSIPVKDDLTIVVDAGSGHRGEWTVKRGEFDTKANKADSA